MSRAAEPGGGRSRLDLRIPPVATLLIGVLLAWLAARALPGLDYHLPAAPWVAGAIALVGVAMAAAGVVTFRRHQTTVDPRSPADASALVTSGIFRYTRNPMYAGLVCLMTAFAVALENFAALAVPPLLFIYLTHYQVRPEERILLDKFGEPYAVYTMRVRRWL